MNHLHYWPIVDMSTFADVVYSTLSNQRRECGILRYNSTQYTQVGQLFSRPGYRFVRNAEVVSDSSLPLQMTFFNGGKAYFKFRDWVKVFEAMSIDVRNDTIFYQNDISHDYCKLFFELDFTSKRTTPDADQIQCFTNGILHVVSTFFQRPRTEFSLWVLRRKGTISIHKDGKSVSISSGCHIIFRDIVVDSHVGRHLVNMCNAELRSMYNLDDAIDIQPYSSSMLKLRPAFSSKIRSCPGCFYDRRLNVAQDQLLFGRCGLCLGKGKVACGAVYKPVYYYHDGIYIHGDTLRAKVNSNLTTVLRECSIIPIDEGGRRMPSTTYTQTSVITPAQTKVSLSVPSFARNIASPGDNTYKNGTKLKSTIPVPEVLLPAIRSMVEWYDRDYRGCSITHCIVVYRRYLIIHLKGPLRHLCKIKCRTPTRHKSNSIYFQIDIQTKRMIQKCYDGECKMRVTSKQAPSVRSKSISRAGVWVKNICTAVQQLLTRSTHTT